MSNHDSLQCFDLVVARFDSQDVFVKVWRLNVAHLNLALGLHHLKFGLGQLLLQLPDLSFQRLLLLFIPPLLCFFGVLTVLTLA